MPTIRAVRLRAVATAVFLAALTFTAVAAAQGTGGAESGARPATAQTSGSLKLGDRGSDVRRLQRALKVADDGIFGPRTRRAVKRYQRAHGLPDDGVAGPATLDRLGVVLRAPLARAQSVLDPATKATLDRIAECESGGNPRAIGAGGRYRGKYQFSRETWKRLGGKGDPAKASEATQDRIAAKLLKAEGTAPWPVCG